MERAKVAAARRLRAAADALDPGAAKIRAEEHACAQRCALFAYGPSQPWTSGRMLATNVITKARRQGAESRAAG